MFNRPSPSQFPTAFADSTRRTSTRSRRTAARSGARRRSLSTRPSATASRPCRRARRWTVEGCASFEDDDTTGQRDKTATSARAAATRCGACSRAPRFTVAAGGAAHGHDDARDRTASDPPSRDPRWWHARATASPTPARDDRDGDGRAGAPGGPPEPDPDPRPTEPRRPDFFRKIGVRVELVRGTFVRAELYGEFDIHTAAEERITASTTATPPVRTNPNDGICTFLVRLRIAEDRSSWLVSAEFRAIEGDLDGLAKLERGATGDQTAVDIVGRAGGPRSAPLRRDAALPHRGRAGADAHPHLGRRGHRRERHHRTARDPPGRRARRHRRHRGPGDRQRPDDDAGEHPARRRDRLHLRPRLHQGPTRSSRWSRATRPSACAHLGRAAAAGRQRRVRPATGLRPQPRATPSTSRRARWLPPHRSTRSCASWASR